MAETDGARRIQRVLDECLRRRAAGEVLPDEDVIAEHPELMPELQERLAALQLIEQAGQRAEESEDSSSVRPVQGPAATSVDHIEGHCPHCQARWRVRAEHAGRRLRCRKCHGVFTPAESSSAAAGMGARRDSRTSTDSTDQSPKRERGAIPDQSPKRQRGAIPNQSPKRERGVIPGYEIEGELGHGGMGRVYQARELATKRTVALKVMLAGRYGDERHRRRFEREVEIAAGLEHPHIARIYASGLHEGHHWFAMEYVEGERLDEYVEREQLGIRDTLALFARICNAVNHAHQRGIMHRDLKPANILVDERNQPHVLDFGLAKLLDRRFTGETPAPPDVAPGVPLEAVAAGVPPAEAAQSISLPGEVAGTPAYMSPEQTRGDPGGLDIRSDVYSLGVILYRLLTGQSPYDEPRASARAAPARAVSLPELLRAIADHEPASPRRLRKEIPDEVDAIVLKALRKDAAERYQTAGELARDLEAYLAGDAVLAKQGSGWYTLRKIAGRYKGVAAVAATVVILSLGLGLTMSVLFVKTRIEYRDVLREVEVYRQHEAAAVELLQVELAEAQERVEWLRGRMQELTERTTRAQAEAKALRLRAQTAEAAADEALRTELADARASEARLRAEVEALREDELRGAQGDIALGDYAKAERSLWASLAVKDNVRARFLLSELARRSGLGGILWVDPAGLACSALSRDGKLLAAGSYDGDIVVIDLTRRRPVRVLPAYDVGVAGLAFDPDGTRLVSAARNGTVHVWDTSAWTVKHEWSVKPSTVWHSSLSDTGTLAIATSNAGVVLYDIRRGRPLRPLGSPDGKYPLAYRVALSPDGRRCAAWYRVKRSHTYFALWDVSRGRTTEEESRPNWNISDAKCAPKGAHIWATVAKHVKQYKGVEETRAISADGSYLARLAISPSGELIAAGNGGGTVFVLEARRKKLVRTFQGHTRGVTSLQFLPDEVSLISTAADGEIRRWQLEDLPETDIVQMKGGYVAAVAVTRDERHLISTETEWDVRGHVHIIDRASKAVVRSYARDGEDFLQLALSPSEELIATAGRHQALVIWQFERGADPVVLNTRGQAVRTMCFSPDSRLLAAALSDGHIRVWNSHSGHEVAFLQGEEGPVQVVRFLDARTLSVHEGATGRLVKWPIRGGQKEVVREGLPITGSLGEFSQDGRWYAVWDPSYTTITIYDAHTGECTGVIRTPDRVFSCWYFSPDSRLLATGGAGGSIRLWEVPSGAFVGALTGHKGGVPNVCFTSDGQTLISGGHDLTIRLWPVAIDNEGIDRARDYGLRLVLKASLQRGEHDRAFELLANLSDPGERNAMSDFVGQGALAWFRYGQIERAHAFAVQMTDAFLSCVYNERAIRGVAGLLLVGERPAEAADWYERLARTAQVEAAAGLWGRVGRAALLAGDSARANAAFERALQGAPGDDLLWRRFAEFELGRISEREFVRSDQDDQALQALAWFFLGEHYSARGQTEAARERYTQCLALAQDTSAALRGWAAWRLQQLGPAEQE